MEAAVAALERRATHDASEAPSRPRTATTITHDDYHDHAYDRAAAAADDDDDDDGDDGAPRWAGDARRWARTASPPRARSALLDRWRIGDDGDNGDNGEEAKRHDADFDESRRSDERGDEGGAEGALAAVAGTSAWLRAQRPALFADRARWDPEVSDTCCVYITLHYKDRLPRNRRRVARPDRLPPSTTNVSNRHGTPPAAGAELRRPRSRRRRARARRRGA